MDEITYPRTIEVWELPLKNIITHFKIYDGCDYLSMLGLKVILVDKSGPRFLWVNYQHTWHNYMYYVYHYLIYIMPHQLENELQCIKIWAKLVPFWGVFKMHFPGKMCVFKVWNLFGGESESWFSVVMPVTGSGKGFVPDDSKPLSGHIHAGRNASNLALQCTSLTFSDSWL